MIVALATVNGIKVQVEKPARPASKSIGQKIKDERGAANNALQVKFLVQNASSPDIPERNRMLYHAVVSGMSGEAFMQLFVLQTFGSGRGLMEVFPSNATLAGISNRSESSVKRALAELDEKGFMSSRRRRNSSSIRTLKIPQSSLDRIVAEVSERSDLTLLPKSTPVDGRERSDLTRQKGQIWPPNLNQGTYTTERESVAEREARRDEAAPKREKKASPIQLPGRLVSELAGAMQCDVVSQPVGQPESPAGATHPTSTLKQPQPETKPSSEGVAFYGDRPMLMAPLTSEIHVRAGVNAPLFGRAWDSVKHKLLNRPPEFIRAGALRMADCLRSSSDVRAAVRNSFGGAFA